MIDLSGKTAVVTSGSRSIGQATVLRLAAQGADVCFSYRGNVDAIPERLKRVLEGGDPPVPLDDVVPGEPEHANREVLA